MMKRAIVSALLAVCVLLSLGGCGTPAAPSDTTKTYTNPVYDPVFADPSVVEYEGKYYAFATEDNGEWKPSDDPLENEAGTKCVPILESSDLVHWYYQKAAFVGLTKPTWGTPGANVWAPDVVRIGDKFVMYYALSTWGDPDPGIGIATADQPLGPWTDRGKLFTSLEIGVNNSIDPAVFPSPEGKLYIIWGSFRGLYGVELTADGLGLQGGIEAAAQNKVRVAGLDTSTGWNGATYEAPYVVYNKGYYYLFVSSGTCCDGFNSTYHVRVGRSKNPLGPYVDDNGNDMCAENRGAIVVQGGDNFVGVGHNAVIKDKAGNWYLLYHGFDKAVPYDKYATSNRRALLLDKLDWSGDFPFVKDFTAGRSGIAPVVKA